jgi:hypothetical protein
MITILLMPYFFLFCLLLLVAGVQLYNRHSVSVCQSVSPSVRQSVCQSVSLSVRSDFSEPVGVGKLKIGTNVFHISV